MYIEWGCIGGALAVLEWLTVATLDPIVAHGFKTKNSTCQENPMMIFIKKKTFVYRSRKLPIPTPTLHRDSADQVTYDTSFYTYALARKGEGIFLI